jgi:hypothetical protein
MVLDISKNCDAFKMTGTTPPVTQHHIPEGLILSNTAVRTPNLENVGIPNIPII